ncbi:hypothetical protein EV687_0944 [Corticibacter populi]|nr:hypothetical protein EV687_0944 [Corticibacter populi]
MCHGMGFQSKYSNYYIYSWQGRCFHGASGTVALHPRRGAGWPLASIWRVPMLMQAAWLDRGKGLPTDHRSWASAGPLRDRCNEIGGPVATGSLVGVGGPASLPHRAPCAHRQPWPSPLRHPSCCNKECGRIYIRPEAGVRRDGTSASAAKTLAGAYSRRARPLPLRRPSPAREAPHCRPRALRKCHGANNDKRACRMTCKPLIFGGASLIRTGDLRIMIPR